MVASGTTCSIVDPARANRSFRFVRRKLRSIDLVDQGKEFIVGGYIAHGLAIVNKAYDAFLVDDGLGWHSAELEQLNFLPVAFQHSVFRIGQAQKGQAVFAEVLGEVLGTVGTDDQDGHTSLVELIICLAQLRHVLAAERSHEAAIEYEQDILLIAIM